MEQFVNNQSSCERPLETVVLMSKVNTPLL